MDLAKILLSHFLEHGYGLEFDGKFRPLSAEFSLRWIDLRDGLVRPVLYYQGKRVTQEWALILACRVAADPTGGNTNTAEVPHG